MSAAGQIIIRSRSEAATISGLGRQHSIESKRKISLSRKKFLVKNPDMVPYKLNHKHKKISFPEQYFKECFGDVFHYQYRVGLYELDFADIENQIDIEIDGDQHFLDERIMLHDQKRNKELSELGWKIIRIKWSSFQKLSRKEKELIVTSIVSNKSLPNIPCIFQYNSP
jgi:very-short-patch-repair endonuclease